MNFITQLLRALLALLLFSFAVQPADAGTVKVTIGEFGPGNNVFMKWGGSLGVLPNYGAGLVTYSQVFFSTSLDTGVQYFLGRFHTTVSKSSYLTVRSVHLSQVCLTFYG